MGRYRANANPVDQEVSKRLEEAKRSIFSALRVLEKETKSSSGVALRRVSGVRRDLFQVLGVIDNVRKLAPSFLQEGEPEKVKPEETRQVQQTVIVEEDPVEESGEE